MLQLVLVKRIILTGAALLLCLPGVVYAHPQPTVAAARSAAVSPRSTPGSAAAGATGYAVVSFCDVNANTPHEASILELAAMGIVSGLPGGTCGSDS